MTSNYHLKIVPRAFLFVGIFHFIVLGFSALVIDYGETFNDIMIEKIIMFCLTVVPSFLFIWCSVAMRVFVYHDKLVYRTMFLRNQTLYFDEILYYEYKTRDCYLNFVSLDGDNLRMNFDSHNNILKLTRILTERGIHKVSDD